MKTEEGLARDGEREIERKEQDEAENRRDPRDQEHGKNRAGAAQEMQKRVARIKPAERRQRPDSARLPSCSCAAARNCGIGEIPCAPISPSTCTQSETKRDQVDQPERAQKPAARVEIGRAPDILAPEQRGDCVRQFAMPGDEGVGQLRNGRETRNMLVTPAPRIRPPPWPNERKTASAPLKTRPSGSINLTACSNAARGTSGKRAAASCSGS